MTANPAPAPINENPTATGRLEVSINSGIAAQSSTPSTVPPIVISSGMMKCSRSMNDAATIKATKEK